MRDGCPLKGLGDGREVMLGHGILGAGVGWGRVGWGVHMMDGAAIRAK